jgi:hypothetical protein
VLSDFLGMIEAEDVYIGENDAIARLQLLRLAEYL